jgi:maleylpyruvate isomerase
VRVSFSSEDDARAWHRVRQGEGARYDSAAAPARELLWARRGTAYFARKLNDLSDEELDASSLVPGWSRRRVIAHVGYQARFLARIVEAARKGEAMESLAEPEQQIDDIDLAETLPPHALRYLFKHSEVHLNVEWRDLPDAGWAASVNALDGRLINIAATPLMRAQEVWRRALDLNNKARPSDCPPEILAVSH